MKKKPFMILGGLIAVVIVLIVALNHVNVVLSGSQSSTPTPSGPVAVGPVLVVPTIVSTFPKVTDLAPQITVRNKGAVIVRHSDGSREEFLLTGDMVDSFISQLPIGDRIDSIIPPQALMGPPPFQTAIPSLGNQTYFGTPGTIVGTAPSGP